MTKILYAIQGTGNGHVCRAMDIVPRLQEKASVDVLISGTQADVALPFDIKYKLKGLSFIFGKKGGVDILATYRKSHLKKLIREINELPVDQYDLVISDFEPVSSWACYVNNKPCIALSHQAAVLDKNSPQARHADPIGRSILKVYAPASVSYGFHFKAYSDNIYTPVIRKEVREAAVGNKGHYTVYLPAYNDRRIIKALSQCKGVRWEVFSKHFRSKVSIEGIDVFPINSTDFIHSMASAEGVLCGAGFETPAEALYLGKKLLVIPMKRQFEQHCNAAALKDLGVPVMKNLKEKHLPILHDWIASSRKIEIQYPDMTATIIDDILRKHLLNTPASHRGAGPSAEVLHEPLTAKRFKTLTLGKIISKLAD